MNLLNKLIGRAEASVDSIIADIQTRIAKLHVVAEAKAAAVAVHNEEIALRQKLAAEASLELNRAKSIAAKFTALIS